jgi:uncharacterized lipoprotein YmbA
MTRNTLLLCLAVAACAGCASTTTQHFTLDMRPSESASPGQLAARHFTVADALANMNIPVRTGPTTLEYYEGVQWAGSLEDLLKEKFQAEFGASVAADGARVIDGHVLAFEQVDLPGGAAEAHCKIEVQVRAAGDSRYAKPLLAKVYDVSSPMAVVTPGTLTESLSRCVEQIAAQVRADVAGL